MEMNIRVVGCFLRLLLDDGAWRNTVPNSMSIFSSGTGGRSRAAAGTTEKDGKMEMNIIRALMVVGCFLRLLLDDIRWRMEEHGSQLHVHIFIGDGRSIPGGCGRRRRRREYVRAYGYRFICLRHNTGKIENCFRLYFIFVKD